MSCSMAPFVHVDVHFVFACPWSIKVFKYPLIQHCTSQKYIDNFIYTSWCKKNLHLSQIPTRVQSTESNLQIA